MGSRKVEAISSPGVRRELSDENITSTSAMLDPAPTIAARAAVINTNFRRILLPIGYLTKAQERRPEYHMV